MTKSYSIVGMNFQKTEDFVKTLQPGAEAVLVREPDNQFDPLAVAVWIDGRRVGYVPKAQNKVLAAFIDQAGTPWEEPAQIATDGKTSMSLRHLKTIPAKFIRSPNSGYPMIEVS